MTVLAIISICFSILAISFAIAAGVWDHQKILAFLAAVFMVAREACSKIRWASRTASNANHNSNFPSSQSSGEEKSKKSEAEGDHHHHHNTALSAAESDQKKNSNHHEFTKRFHNKKQHQNGNDDDDHNGIRMSTDENEEVVQQSSVCSVEIESATLPPHSSRPPQAEEERIRRLEKKERGRTTGKGEEVVNSAFHQHQYQQQVQVQGNNQHVHDVDAVGSIVHHVARERKEESEEEGGKELVLVEAPSVDRMGWAYVDGVLTSPRATRRTVAPSESYQCQHEEQHNNNNNTRNIDEGGVKQNIHEFQNYPSSANGGCILATTTMEEEEEQQLQNSLPIKKQAENQKPPPPVAVISKADGENLLRLFDHPPSSWKPPPLGKEKEGIENSPEKGKVKRFEKRELETKRQHAEHEEILREEVEEVWRLDPPWEGLVFHFLGGKKEKESESEENTCEKKKKGGEITTAAAPLSSLSTTCVLRQISLSFARLTGTVHSSFSSCLPRTLVRVNLSSNGCSGVLDLGNLPPCLEKLELQDNQWSGSVHLDALPSTLRVLNLSSNQLSGHLNLTQLPRSLQRLNLDYNAFSGSIDLTNLPVCLEVLSVYLNQLSSHVDLTQLPPQLKLLSLGINQFTGRLDLHHLPSSLKKLNLEGNRWVGSIDLDALREKYYCSGSSSFLYSMTANLLSLRSGGGVVSPPPILDGDSEIDMDVDDDALKHTQQQATAEKKENEKSDHDEQFRFKSAEKEKKVEGEGDISPVPLQVINPYLYFKRTLTNSSFVSQATTNETTISCYYDETGKLPFALFINNNRSPLFPLEGIYEFPLNNSVEF